jgi:hypothetical protein
VPHVEIDGDDWHTGEYRTEECILVLVTAAAIVERERRGSFRRLCAIMVACTVKGAKGQAGPDMRQLVERLTPCAALPRRYPVAPDVVYVRQYVARAAAFYAAVWRVSLGIAGLDAGGLMPLPRDSRPPASMAQNSPATWRTRAWYFQGEHSIQPRWQIPSFVSGGFPHIGRLFMHGVRCSRCA